MSPHAEIEARLADLAVEVPSWAFAASGTRFAVFAGAGLPRDVFEKLEDAAEVARCTGSARSVALHIPWDRLDDPSLLRARADELGLRLGAVNPNLFQDQEYRLGSLANPDPAVRRRAVAHLDECLALARELGSGAISLWLGDGTNYAGQDSFRARRARLVETLSPYHDACAATGVELLVEYKLFEPAFYATDLADWGSALSLCRALGESARVLVDLGHHAHGVNVEQIVALLQLEGRLGGFHFNDRRYGDDDLIAGSSNPLELFLIFLELVQADAPLPALTVDQSHNVEAKVEAMIETVVNLQEAYAKALLVDRAALAAAQAEGDVLGAHRIVMDAFKTDVRPLCARVRERLGAAADPVAAHRDSGYAARVAAERAEGVPAGWS